MGTMLFSNTKLLFGYIQVDSSLFRTSVLLVSITFKFYKKKTLSRIRKRPSVLLQHRCGQEAASHPEGLVTYIWCKHKCKLFLFSSKSPSSNVYKVVKYDVFCLPSVFAAVEHCQHQNSNLVKPQNVNCNLTVLTISIYIPGPFSVWRLLMVNVWKELDSL